MTRNEIKMRLKNHKTALRNEYRLGQDIEEYNKYTPEGESSLSELRKEFQRQQAFNVETRMLIERIPDELTKEIIVTRYVHGKNERQCSFSCFVSERTVYNHLRKGYDFIYQQLESGSENED